MDDRISRKAVLDAFNTNLNELVVGGEKNAKTVENYLNGVLNKIKCLPTEEPKTGKWINVVDGIEYTWANCNKCGARIPMAYKYYNFCPNCGERKEQGVTAWKIT